MSKLLQKAIDNFDEVWPILQKIDFEPSRKYWEKWAYNKHVQLLKKNKSLFNRVQTIQSLVDEKMKAQSLVFACGISKILEDISEGETHYYANLAIRKVEGKIMVNVVGGK